MNIELISKGTTWNQFLLAFVCVAQKNLKKLNKGHRQVFNSAAHILNENACEYDWIFPSNKKEMFKFHIKMLMLFSTHASLPLKRMRELFLMFDN